MARKLAILMDPIHSINPRKDSSLAMLLEATLRQWSLYYFEQSDLFSKDGTLFIIAQPLMVYDSNDNWHKLGEPTTVSADELDLILIRKDPPFDAEYIYTTHLLELAQKANVKVINNPSGIRNNNEKLAILNFPQCTTPTLVTQRFDQLHSFLDQHRDIILKPLDAMGGHSIFRVKKGDQNTQVIFETMTNYETCFIMAQTFIPDISQGDKRILLIDGEPIPYALARIPANGELRGNLAAGGSGVGVELSDRDLWICQQIKPYLKDNGLLFVGIDVIGNYLTEINVTSPTCIRELDSIYSINICGMLFDTIEKDLVSD